MRLTIFLGWCFSVLFSDSMYWSSNWWKRYFHLLLWINRNYIYCIISIGNYNSNDDFFFMGIFIKHLVTVLYFWVTNDNRCTRISFLIFTVFVYLVHLHSKSNRWISESLHFEGGATKYTKTVHDKNHKSFSTMTQEYEIVDI